MPNKPYTTEDFINKARSVHGDKYDYSKVKYINGKSKVTIICPIHGEFEQVASEHLRGSGCFQCRVDSTKLSLEEFIRRSKEIHGDKYDYSKVKYINSKTPVTIICPIHGEFEQTPGYHLVGRGCRECYLISKFLTTEEFIRKSKEIHGDKYDYSKTNYIDNKSKVTIICPIHGEFEQIAAEHLRGHGCPKCYCSKLENLMRSFLEKENINFIEQKTWDWLIFKGNQHVDFYLPEYNIAIECQGRQHFEPVNSFGGIPDFEDRQERDKNKLELCTKHNIKLIYFSNLSTKDNPYPYPYKVYENLEELMSIEIR